METRLQWIGCTSLALSFFAVTSLGYAQPARPWVDPPPEAGAAPSRPLSSSPAGEMKPVTSQPSPPPSEPSMAAKRNGAGTEQAKQQTREAAPSTLKNPPRKVASERKDRRSARTATANSERRRQTVQRRELADTELRGTRVERTREGTYTGLQVMTLRTIEFPDGRRVQILTGPGPEAMSRFTEVPY